MGVPLDKGEGIVKAYFTEAVCEHRVCFPERGLRTKCSGRFTLHHHTLGFRRPPTIDTA
jgi:hypothetical protein